MRPCCSARWNRTPSLTTLPAVSTKGPTGSGLSCAVAGEGSGRGAEGVGGGCGREGQQPAVGLRVRASGPCFVLPPPVLRATCSRPADRAAHVPSAARRAVAAGFARRGAVAAGSVRRRAGAAGSARGGHADGGSSSSFGRRQSRDEGDKHTPPAALAPCAGRIWRQRAATRRLDLGPAAGERQQRRVRTRRGSAGGGALRRRRPFP